MSPDAPPCFEATDVLAALLLSACDLLPDADHHFLGAEAVEDGLRRFLWVRLALPPGLRA